jgi:hypothetical protein
MAVNAGAGKDADRVMEPSPGEFRQVFLWM